MNINKININQSESSYYIATDIYDVSAHNNGTTFESLSALLSSDNLSTLIPTAVRCGGMTIRFVQSSDNKYVQYRLMTSEWSLTESDWQDAAIIGTDMIADEAITAEKIADRTIEPVKFKCWSLPVFYNHLYYEGISSKWVYEFKLGASAHVEAQGTTAINLLEVLKNTECYLYFMLWPGAGNKYPPFVILDKQYNVLGTLKVTDDIFVGKLATYPENASVKNNGVGVYVKLELPVAEILTMYPDAAMFVSMVANISNNYQNYIDCKYNVAVTTDLGHFLPTAIGEYKITTNKINNNAVTTQKIADGAITTQKMADEAMSQAMINEIDRLDTHIKEVIYTEETNSLSYLEKVDGLITSADGTVSLEYGNNYKHYIYEVQTNAYYRVSSTQTNISSNQFALISFFDSEGLYIKDSTVLFSMNGGSDALDNYLVMSPDNAATMKVAGYTSKIPVVSYITLVSKIQKNREAIDKLTVDLKNQYAPNNHWRGEKLAILGTSVAFGQVSSFDLNPLDLEQKGHAYAQEASKILGFDIIPAGVPGLAINSHNVTYVDENENTNNVWACHKYGSSTMSKEEYSLWSEVRAKILDGTYEIMACTAPAYQSYISKVGTTYETNKDAGIAWCSNETGDIPTFPDAPVEWIADVSYNNYYRTWENIFNEDSADCKLWIFACAPNNTNASDDDIKLFDFNNWQYNDGSSFASHRSTFLGAMLFLLDKMYALNKYARCIFVLDSEFFYNGSPYAGKLGLQYLSDKMKIPLIDFMSIMGTGTIKGKSVFKSRNGTDSHPSGYAQMLMGKIFANRILLNA